MWCELVVALYFRLVYSGLDLQLSASWGQQVDRVIANGNETLVGKATSRPLGVYRNKIEQKRSM